tara:strand:+ start:1397 stop:1771 length:375 start_codon:yes stop_codon:yes gene_type:complete
MKTNRPIYISLTKFSWPITAISSIAARITGVILVLSLGPFGWLLDLALGSEAGFLEAKGVLQLPLPKLFLILCLGALFYHFFSGIKHILMDFGYGEELVTAKKVSVSIWILSVCATSWFGIWLW